MVCIAIAPTSCFVICLSLHFIARSGSIPQSQTDLQTSTNGHFVRRELDLNVTPTASMEEEHSKVAVALTQSKNKDVEVQSNHMPRQAKEKGVVSSKGRKLSEEDKRKKKYENNRLCVQRYRFKYSKEGQKIAAETLGPIEKAEYDRKFNQLREKRKGYKAKYYQNVKIGVEKNDPKAIARNVMIQDSNRKASRKYMRRVRAQKTLNGKKQPVEATPDAIQPFVRRMDPKEPGTTPDSSEKNGKRKRTEIEQIKRNAASAKYRQKFSKDGQEQAKLLDPEAKAKYYEQLTRYTTRKQNQERRYHERMRTLALQGESKSIKKLANYKQKHYIRNITYRKKRRLQKAKANEDMLSKEPSTKRLRTEESLLNTGNKGRPEPTKVDKAEIPDLNELPPPEQH